MQRPSVKSLSLAGCPDYNGKLTHAKFTLCTAICPGSACEQALVLSSRLHQLGGRTPRQNLESIRPLWRNALPPMQKLQAVGKIHSSIHPASAE